MGAQLALDEISQANKKNNILDKVTYDREMLKLRLKHGFIHPRGIVSHKLLQLSKELTKSKEQEKIKEVKTESWFKDRT